MYNMVMKVNDLIFVKHFYPHNPFCIAINRNTVFGWGETILVLEFVNKQIQMDRNIILLVK